MSTVKEDRKTAALTGGLVDKPTHPVAAGICAVLLGGAAGAATGTIAGPVGAVIGAAFGAITGALGGDAVAASVDQIKEEAHWRENHATRPYVAAGAAYADYEPAYRYGLVWYQLNPGRDFDECEVELAIGWVDARGDSPLAWPRAKPAVREAWYRVSDLAARAKTERADSLET